MSRVRLTVIGDALLDRDVEGEATRLTPDAPAPVLDEREVCSRPGGAGLAALLAADDGFDVTLVTALGDAAGAEVARLLAGAGVEVVDLGLAAATPEKIRLRAQGASLARWDRGGRARATDVGPWSAQAQAAIDGADGVLVSCYGRGVAGRRDVRAAVAAAAARRPVVWDPHPGGAPPVAGVALAVPNEAEAAHLVPEIPGEGLDAVSRRAAQLVARWGVGAVTVTRGGAGALLVTGDGLPMAVPAPQVVPRDSCGAGDRFAAAAAGRLAAGAVLPAAVGDAVAAAARFVGDGGATSVRPRARLAADGGTPRGDGTPRSVVERVRAEGGTVVATGGCFDLLHAGHVHVLEAARALGDHLVVCVNSDASIRRLKGPDRPVVAERDRVAMLEALECVDEVVVFDEDTPVETLRRLRPDVFAKGGDYGASRIPEAEALASWGGQAVTLPYLDGRSTTRILERMRTPDRGPRTRDGHRGPGTRDGHRGPGTRDGHRGPGTPGANRGPGTRDAS